MDQKYLTDSESLSLNIEATCLLLSSSRNFQYEIKTDKYRPYPSMISMFTSDSQHPPKSRHAVHLGVAPVSFPRRGGGPIFSYEVLYSRGAGGPDGSQIPYLPPPFWICPILLALHLLTINVFWKFPVLSTGIHLHQYICCPS